MKIALFDFCETLVNFQTADYFVEYTLKKYKKNNKYESIIKNSFINKILEKNWRFRKKLHLFFLRGLSENEINIAANEYYEKYIKPNMFTYMIQVIKEYKNKNYKVYIVSGGYSIYINQYAKEYGLDGVIANDFIYKEKCEKKIFTGYICGHDCMGEEKVKRLNRIFKKGDIEDSVSYSDNLSDLPLLKWTKSGVLVSKYKERKAAKENNLRQIVLSELESSNTVFEFDGIIQI